MALDALDPFLTFARSDVDMSASDERTEAQALAERQGIIQSWLSGDTAEDHVLETLLDQGINPDHYVETVIDNIDYVVDQGIVFTSNENGILLPRHL